LGKMIDHSRTQVRPGKTIGSSSELKVSGEETEQRLPGVDNRNAGEGKSVIKLVDWARPMG